jgi:sphingomyelin phosphodiesterase
MGFPTDPSKQAQKWGDYNCDLPQVTLESMLAYIRDTVKPDIVIWTGDSVSSDMWELQESNIVKDVTTVSNLVSSYLGSIASIYLGIGNHDLYPINIYDFNEPNINSEVNSYSSGWSSFLDADSISSLKRYGYYSADLKFKNGTVVKNSKVISVNSFSCYYYNFDILKAEGDPSGQLEWLISELEKLEKVNGTAWIISHVPNTNECEPGWGKRYHAILERYQHVVRFSMHGHLHREEF